MPRLRWKIVGKKSLPNARPYFVAKHKSFRRKLFENIVRSYTKARRKSISIADAPCSSISQDDVAALITVDDFDIPALREAAEKAEEKNRDLPRKIRMDKFLRKPFPKSLIRLRPATSKLVCPTIAPLASSPRDDE